MIRRAPGRLPRPVTPPLYGRPLGPGRGAGLVLTSAGFATPDGRLELYPRDGAGWVAVRRDCPGPRDTRPVEASAANLDALRKLLKV